MTDYSKSLNRITQDELTIIEGYLAQGDRRLNVADATRLIQALVDAYAFIDAEKTCEISGVNKKYLVQKMIEGAGAWRNARDIVHDNPPPHLGEIQSMLEAVIPYLRTTEPVSLTVGAFAIDEGNHATYQHMAESCAKAWGLKYV